METALETALEIASKKAADGVTKAAKNKAKSSPACRSTAMIRGQELNTIIMRKKNATTVVRPQWGAIQY